MIVLIFKLLKQLIELYVERLIRFQSQNMEVVKHFKLFRCKIKIWSNNELIVDIGSGDGSLLRNFINKSKIGTTL